MHRDNDFEFSRQRSLLKNVNWLITSPLNLSPGTWSMLNTHDQNQYYLTMYKNAKNILLHFVLKLF